MCKILHYQDGDTLGSINYEWINIDVLKEFTFLGFIFDNKLNFKSHINNLVTKLSKINYFLKKSSFSLSIKNLRMLYNAFFLSNLMYGTELWGNNCVTNLKPIELVQKRAIRIINKHIFINNRLTHTTPLFIKCKCIKFIDIIDLRNMLFMYQVYYKKLPLNSLDNFSMCNSYNISRSSTNFKLPSTKSSRFHNSIFFKGPKCWNNFINIHPDFIFYSKLSFKNNFKKYILSSYTH